MYRIASNKRPTSRKRLSRINAPFFIILFYKSPLRINVYSKQYGNFKVLDKNLKTMNY